MSKTDFRTLFAENRKAKDFAKNYFREHGEMPSEQEVDAAKVLTLEEKAELEFEKEVSAAVSLSNHEISEVAADWDYIWNEETWNASYENGVLKDYYVWADSLSPYKEDLWNTVELRPANWNDIEKDEHGQPIEYEDGYHYLNCVRCWLGAVNAPGAAYPWCGVKISAFNGYIEFAYEDKTAFPWGEKTRAFKRTFAIASIPTELGMEYKLDAEGHTTFVPENLDVTLIKVVK